MKQETCPMEKKGKKKEKTIQIRKEVEEVHLSF